MGIMNRGVVYALWDYDAESPDELSFKEGDCLTVLRREDSEETEWWWARCADNEGYIPRNLLGVRNFVLFFFPQTFFFTTGCSYLFFFCSCTPESSPDSGALRKLSKSALMCLKFCLPFQQSLSSAEQKDILKNALHLHGEKIRIVSCRYVIHVLRLKALVEEVELDAHFRKFKHV